MTQPTGKTALITGASVGIGRDLAHLFAQDGHNLILTARNQEQLEQVSQQLIGQYQIQAHVMPADLSVPTAPQELYEQIQSRGISVDFLVNNAGFGAFGKFAKSDIAVQMAMIQVNITSVVQLTRLFLPEMLKRKNGRILNVASTAAFMPGPYMSVYYASKAFLLSFSEAVDAEIIGSGVTITALCPGMTETEFHKRAGVGKPPGIMGGVMKSMDVAKIGYRAMLAGKRTVVSGLANKVMVTGAKFAPRSVTAAIARKVNANR